MRTSEIGAREPWWTLMREGQKKVEGRKRTILRGILGLPDSTLPADISEQDAVGVRLRVRRDNPADATEAPLVFLAVIVAVRSYGSLSEYLDAEGWEKVVPHETVKSYQAAADVYHGIYTPAQIAEAGGMVALELLVLS